jgi:ribosomal protein L37AE/L43A
MDPETRSRSGAIRDSRHVRAQCPFCRNSGIVERVRAMEVTTIKEILSPDLGS